jgi:dTDP-4-dehydrorhamnose reductase
MPGLSAGRVDLGKGLLDRPPGPDQGSAVKIAVAGAAGMLGRTLCAALTDHTVVQWTRSDGDLAEPGRPKALCRRDRPEVVVNCAAYTRVDDAESNVDAAHRGNAWLAGQLAHGAHAVGAHLLHISTDYVFDGTLDRPHRETDAPNPQSEYGRSKWAGEEAVRHHCPSHTIFRIAWLYGRGGPSLLHTALRLAATRPPPLRMVDDQWGNPTSCDAVAALVRRWLDRPFAGTAHATCEGETTWFGFVRRAFELLELDVPVEPTTTDAFPRPAARPKNSRLDNRVLRMAGFEPMPSWESALAAFVRDEKEELLRPFSSSRTKRE